MYVSVSSYELYKALFDMKLYINKQVPTSFEHSAIWFVLLLNIGHAECNKKNSVGHVFTSCSKKV